MRKPKQHKLRINIIFALLVSVGLLFSCSNETNLRKLHAYIENLKTTTKKTKIAKSEPIKLPAPVAYHAETFRAPFVNSQPVSNNKDKFNANPLLVYPVSVLRFVGTISKNNRSIAYVQAPDTKLYQVMIGDAIGDHGGKVIKINPQRIEIVEMVEQESSIGKITTKNNVILELREEKK